MKDTRNVRKLPPRLYSDHPWTFELVLRTIALFWFNMSRTGQINASHWKPIANKSPLYKDYSIRVRGSWLSLAADFLLGFSPDSDFGVYKAWGPCVSTPTKEHSTSWSWCHRTSSIHCVVCIICTCLTWRRPVWLEHHRLDPVFHLPGLWSVCARSHRFLVIGSME